MKNYSFLLVAIAAALWGTTGLFVQILYLRGLSPVHVTAVRVITAAFWLLLYVLLKDKSLLRVKLPDLKYFAATGILSFLFFNWSYFTTVREASLSVAAVLLYTAPAFVAVFSYFIFHEPMTKRKLIALALMILGCACVVGLLPMPKVSVSLFALITGLGSGLGYAMYSVFSKVASSRFPSLTITTYKFILAAAAIIPVSGIWEIKEIIFERQVLLSSFGLGLFPTALAYILYTTGLAKVEASRAAIVANVEPVVSMLIGITLFGDVLSGWQIAGSVLILVAALMVREGGLSSYRPLLRGNSLRH